MDTETHNNWQIYLRAWRTQWIVCFLFAAVALWLFWAGGAQFAAGMAAIAGLFGFFASALVGMAADW